MDQGPPGSRCIRVELGPRGYDVRIGAGLLQHLGDLVAGAVGSVRTVMLAADRGLPGAVVQAAERALASCGSRVHARLLAAEETRKTLEQTEQLLCAMSDERLERGDLLVALGGGIVGDLAGFAAATYRRGIAWVQCPTTLLSMVDASVGGKTGVNLLIPGPGGTGLRKNMVGAFHQPRLVVADLDVLSSLPGREVKAGLAECLKHGMLAAEWGDPDLLAWTESHAAQILSRDTATLSELIARNVAVKARVVGVDEREERPDAGRMLLNLGHTFAHALEALPQLQLPGVARPGLLHGEAVALGLVAASHCSAAAGYCPADLPPRIARALHSLGLGTQVSNLPVPEAVLAHMQHDKKATGGSLRLILPMEPGRSGVFQGVPLAALSAGIESIRA